MALANRRVGVVGLGFGAQVYIPAFQSEGWEVAAICSRTRDKAEKIAAAAGIKDVLTDPLALIARKDLDAIAVATPPREHRDLSVAALQAGKHVLCEKPFAMDAAEGVAMRDAAEKSGRTAMVGHEFRFSPQRTPAARRSRWTRGLPYDRRRPVWIARIRAARTASAFTRSLSGCARHL